MGTQVTILLDEFGIRQVNILIKRLEELFLSVEYHPNDFVILCKINKSVSKQQVQDMLIGYSEAIENIHCHPCDDIPTDDLADRYGFITADKYKG